LHAIARNLRGLIGGNDSSRIGMMRSVIGHRPRSFGKR
jgi:hypothetical protein